MDQVRLLRWHVGDSDRLSDGAQPGDGSIWRHTRLLPLAVGVALFPQLGGAGQVGAVVDRLGGVLQGKVAELALDPAALDGHRTASPPQRGHHGGHSGVVQPDLGQLGQDGRLPRRVAASGEPTPSGARIDMQLAIAASRRPVAAEAPAAYALEQPAQQVHPSPAARPAPAGLAAPDRLDRRP